MRITEDRSRQDAEGSGGSSRREGIEAEWRKGAIAARGSASSALGSELEARAAGWRDWETLGREEGMAAPPPQGAARRQGPEGETGVVDCFSGLGAAALGLVGEQQHFAPQSMPQRHAPALSWGEWVLGVVEEMVAEEERGLRARKKASARRTTCRGLGSGWGGREGTGKADLGWARPLLAIVIWNLCSTEAG